MPFYSLLTNQKTNVPLSTYGKILSGSRVLKSTYASMTSYRGKQSFISACAKGTNAIWSNRIFHAAGKPLQGIHSEACAQTCGDAPKSYHSLNILFGGGERNLPRQRSTTHIGNVHWTRPADIHTNLRLTCAFQFTLRFRSYHLLGSSLFWKTCSCCLLLALPSSCGCI